MVYTKRSFSSVDRGEHHGSIDNLITYASVVKGEKTPNKKYSAAFVDNDVRTESPSLGIATGDFGDGFILVTKRTRRKHGRKVGPRTSKRGTFPGKDVGPLIPSPPPGPGGPSHARRRIASNIAR